MNSSETSIVVTGSTNGIGKAICKKLVQFDIDHLIMVSRTKEKGEQVKNELASFSRKTKITLVQADFTSLSQVRSAGDKICQLSPVIDVLINNAGAYFNEWEETTDGFESTIAINHLAPFLLTYTLVSLLAKSEQGRIVNVSSNAHFDGTLDIDRFRGKPNNYTGWRSTHNPNWLMCYLPISWQRPLRKIKFLPIACIPVW
ncbi:MAG: SDR family NAD(P)-dependent oxidoreductase [Saprospiraceae bacterium]|nr:SDR family NAD(P)-dependent oxidoreductase [Saprospiraceae bacterium]